MSASNKQDIYTANMTQQLKYIDQNGIKALIRERIENPQKYADKPLIIWRADIRDGIQERVLGEVFDEFNPGRATRCWYKTVSVRRMPRFRTEPLRKLLQTDWVDRNDNKPYEPKRMVLPAGMRDKYYNGLFVIDPVCASRDYAHNPESLENYRSLFNNREWQGIKLADGIPVVAYMCLGDDWFETPEAYPDAEQYVFEPDFEEWAQWAVENAGLPAIVADFIRSNGDKAQLAYRWYNKFNDPDAAPLAGGCKYPANWTREVRVRVPWDAVLETAKKEFVKAAPKANEDILGKKFGGVISYDVLADLSRYLIQLNQ